MRGIERMKGYHPGQHGVRFGRLVLHVISNGEGAPWVDDAWLTTDDGRRFGGKCLSLVLRRNRFGERLGGFALFVGWRDPAHDGRGRSTWARIEPMEPSGG